mgnify:CR=1 FL=1
MYDIVRGNISNSGLLKDTGLLFPKSHIKARTTFVAVLTKTKAWEQIVMNRAAILHNRGESRNTNMGPFFERKKDFENFVVDSVSHY